MTGRITWLPQSQSWSQRQQEAGEIVPDPLPELRERYGSSAVELPVNVVQLEDEQRSMVVDATIAAWRAGKGKAAAAIQFVADAVQDADYVLMRDRPHADDVQLTLALLAEGRRHPRDDGREILDIDWMSYSQLHLRAWQLFGDSSAMSWEALAPEQLSAAQLALAATTAAAALESGPGGRPPTSKRAGVPIVDAVLRAWEGSLRAAELAKLREAALIRGVRRHHVDDGESKDETRQLSRARQELLRSCLEACGIAAGEKNIEQLISKAKGGRVV